MPDHHGDNFCPYDIINPDGSDFMAEYGNYFNNPKVEKSSHKSVSGSGLGTFPIWKKVVIMLIAPFILAALNLLIIFILSLLF